GAIVDTAAGRKPSPCGANRAVAVTAWCSFAKLRCMTALEQRCRETLERSWTVGERDGVSFAYTPPSPERYRWQWYRDSCFAAIAWRDYDAARSFLLDEHRYWTAVSP